MTDSPAILPCVGCGEPTSLTCPECGQPTCQRAVQACGHIQGICALCLADRLFALDAQTATGGQCPTCSQPFVNGVYACMRCEPQRYETLLELSEIELGDPYP